MTRSRSDADAAKAWLTAHPVAGLALGGTLTSTDGVSAIFERPPQKQDDSIGFEFTPSGQDVVIRVDVLVVPAGAECSSSGGPARGVGR